MLDPVVLAQLAELDFQNGAIRMGGASVSDTSPRADIVTDAAATTLERAVLRGEINYVPTSNAHPFRTQRDHS